MTVKYVLAAALVLGLAASAFAADGSQFVIIKDKNKHCRIIQQNMVSDDQLTMQVGKQGYPTRDEANIDVKVLCDTP
jgi:opacity protein-like surface antigen